MKLSLNNKYNKYISVKLNQDLRKYLLSNCTFTSTQRPMKESVEETINCLKQAAQNCLHTVQKVHQLFTTYVVSTL